MSKVSLQDVTLENTEACLGLSLPEEQLAFIPDVASSLAMAANYPDARPLAICAGSGEVVGFGMYGADRETGHWKLFRLMIDEKHQGNGLGIAAAREIIAILKQEHSAGLILVAYHESNTVARDMYSKLGFEEYGQVGSKILAKLA
jgi:diamine N-acetyltransferase